MKSLSYDPFPRHGGCTLRRPPRLGTNTPWRPWLWGAYVGRRLGSVARQVLLPGGARWGARVRPALDEGDVVPVGAQRAGQDAHEVAVVAQVLQEAGHAPAGRAQRLSRVSVTETAGTARPPPMPLLQEPPSGLCAPLQRGPTEALIPNRPEADKPGPGELGSGQSLAPQ